LAFFGHIFSKMAGIARNLAKSREMT